MRCNYCGFELDPGAAFCNRCGAKQNVSNQCPICGTACAPEMTFCPTCGGSLTQPPTPMPPNKILIDHMPIGTISPIKKEKPKKGASFAIAIILAIFSFTILIGLCVTAACWLEAEDTIAWYEGENDALRDDLNQERADNDALNAQLSDIRSELKKWEAADEYISGDLMIKINEVYNGYYGGDKISNTLYARNMRYLFVDYDVLWLEKSFKSNLYIDIYGPDGKIIRNSSYSPTGHTMNALATEGNHWNGWGNSSSSIYSAGEYFIVFVYENEIICAKQVNIY